MRPATHRAARVAAMTLTAAVCFFAASCGPLSRSAADRELFTIDAVAPVPASVPAPAGPTRPPDARAIPASAGASAEAPALRIRRLQVVNPYGGTAFVYRKAGGGLRTDYYNGFIVPPAELLTGALIESLSRTGGFSTVVDSASGVPARYVLEGNVTALYGDYTDRGAPKAVITMRIFVLDERARGSRLAFQKEYHAAARIKPGSAASLVDGWNRATRSILEQVDADLPSRLAPATSEQPVLKVDVR